MSFLFDLNALLNNYVIQNATDVKKSALLLSEITTTGVMPDGTTFLQIPIRVTSNLRSGLPFRTRLFLQQRVPNEENSFLFSKNAWIPDFPTACLLCIDHIKTLLDGGTLWWNGTDWQNNRKGIRVQRHTYQPHITMINPPKSNFGGSCYFDDEVRPSTKKKTPVVTITGGPIGSDRLWNLCLDGEEVTHLHGAMSAFIVTAAALYIKENPSFFDSGFLHKLSDFLERKDDTSDDDSE